MKCRDASWRLYINKYPHGITSSIRSRESSKIIAMSVFFAAIGGLMMFSVSGVFPQVYNTSDEVRSLASTLIRIIVCFMPIHAFLHAVYFSIRSGGKTFITFLFDSVYLWIISFPFIRPNPLI